MTPTTAQLQQRNQEIGARLQQARTQHHRSVSECANLLGTSRRRYSAIERGEVAISAAELELLLPFLGVPLEFIWRVESEGEHLRQVVVQARPGERVELVVEVQR